MKELHLLLTLIFHQRCHHQKTDTHTYGLTLKLAALVEGKQYLSVKRINPPLKWAKPPTTPKDWTRDK